MNILMLKNSLYISCYRNNVSIWPWESPCSLVWKIKGLCLLIIASKESLKRQWWFRNYPLRKCIMFFVGDKTAFNFVCKFLSASTGRCNRWCMIKLRNLFIIFLLFIIKFFTSVKKFLFCFVCYFEIQVVTLLVNIDLLFLSITAAKSLSLTR